MPVLTPTHFVSCRHPRSDFAALFNATTFYAILLLPYWLPPLMSDDATVVTMNLRRYFSIRPLCHNASRLCASRLSASRKQISDPMVRSSECALRRYANSRCYGGVLTKSCLKTHYTGGHVGTVPCRLICLRAQSRLPIIAALPHGSSGNLRARRRMPASMTAVFLF